ncbi:ParB/Srx family N-terminal domain-containing protein [Pseudorhodoplanes sp.]|uniref:ParB/Srx family N-terminal domain-containing protein n=1 Tax=Pseudorhodoplanes sp. TaxID=1934341 RepID=UPI00391D2D42
MNVETRPIDCLIPYVRNARTHSEDQVAQIAASIAEFGFTNPILIGTDDVVIAGHGRLLAAKLLGLSEVPVIVLDHLSDAQRRALVIADNRIAENAGWDEAMLRAELAALRESDFDLGVLGFSDTDLGRILDSIGAAASLGSEVADDVGSHSAASPAPEPSATLAERFGIPPFSVLDARKGWWQERKRAWIDLGIRSELGRGAAPGGSPRPLDRARIAKAASPGGSPLPAANYSKSKARGDGRGRQLA